VTQRHGCGGSHSRLSYSTLGKSAAAAVAAAAHWAQSEASMLVSLAPESEEAIRTATIQREQALKRHRKILLGTRGQNLSDRNCARFMLLPCQAAFSHISVESPTRTCVDCEGIILEKATEVVIGQWYISSSQSYPNSPVEHALAECPPWERFCLRWS
jgi:hypothetical protein